MLEVDVAYPRELHDYHNDLPFMCAKMKINGVEKLVPNLYYKRKYVIHNKPLKQAIDHGLVLEKVHRAIEFKQSAWIREYIDFNTRLRTAAKNDFEKDFYKLLLDPDMLLMFERGIRGGIMQSVHRWAAANNPYMGSEYEKSKPTKYLQLLDANNKKDYGYLLEVDVRYPKKLHDYQNNLPFMCAKMKINGVEKLVPNLYYKPKYVIHVKALVQAFEHGLELERIHRCIEFKAVSLDVRIHRFQHEIKNCSQERL